MRGALLSGSGRMVGLLCVLMLAVLVGRAGAQNPVEYRWVGGPGSAWDDPTSWQWTDDGITGSGVPGENADILLWYTDEPIRYTQPTDPAPLHYRLEVPGWGDGHAHLLIEDGELLFGSFNPSYMKVHGYVQQTGGRVVADYVNIGHSDVNLATYELEGGVLEADVSVGGSGYDGLFDHSGGVLRGDVGVQPGGEYRLYGDGRIESPDLFAVGLCHQEGGVLDVDVLNVWGTVRWNGGQWDVGSLLLEEGELVFPEVTANAHFTDTVDLSKSKVTTSNAQNVHITTGPNSIVFLPEAGDPRLQFASFSTGGLIHRIGDTLHVPADRVLNVPMDIADPVEVLGHLKARDLRTGGHVGQGGRLDLEFLTPQESDVSLTNDGGMIVVENSSWVSGWKLSITQTSGTVSSPTLRVRDGGEVHISGGSADFGRDIYLNSPFSEVTDAVARVVIDDADVTANSLNCINRGRGDNAIYSSFEMGAGSLTLSKIWAGGVFGRPESLDHHVSLIFNSSDAGIRVGRSWSMGQFTTLRAAPGVTVRMDGWAWAPEAERGPQPSLFLYTGTDEQKYEGLNHITLVFENPADRHDLLEVGGADLGDDPNGYLLNFALDGLQVGGDSPTMLALTDGRDNQADGQDSREALYVKHLVIGPGSVLDLNGINVYYQTLDMQGTVDASLGGGLYHVVPEPGGLAALLVLGLGLRRRGRSMRDDF